MTVKRNCAVLIGTALLALAGCSDDAPPADTTATAAGNGVCLTTAQIDHTQILTDTAILFWMKDGKTWVNTMPLACSSLVMEGGFTYENDAAEVCSNSQTIRVRGSGNYCYLGQFTPFEVPKTPLDGAMPVPAPAK